MDIAKLRSKLGLTQVQFANLFDVHPITVSKWERGILKPTLYQCALMMEFDKAAEQVRDNIGAVLVGQGIVAALFLLLKTAQTHPS